MLLRNECLPATAEALETPSLPAEAGGDPDEVTPTAAAAATEAAKAASELLATFKLRLLGVTLEGSWAEWPGGVLEAVSSSRMVI